MRRLLNIAALALAALTFLFVGWAAGLVVLLVQGLFWFAELGRTRAALAYETRCPRGHFVRQYGLFTCGCGAVSESWAWSCPQCGNVHGFLACPTCGLAVKNPMVR